jgi:hypothetical protein
VRIETSQVSKHQSNLDRPLAEARGGDRVPVSTLAHQEIGILVDKRSGNPGRKPRQNLSCPIRGTSVRDPKRVGIAAIEKSEFLRTRKLGHQKSRNPRGIKTVHLEGTRAGDWCHQERPDKKAVHQDIGDPVDKVFVHFGIVKRNTPTSGSQLSANQRRKTVSS